MDGPRRFPAADGQKLGPSQIAARPRCAELAAEPHRALILFAAEVLPDEGLQATIGRLVVCERQRALYPGGATAAVPACAGSGAGRPSSNSITSSVPPVARTGPMKRFSTGTNSVTRPARPKPMLSAR
jgi:hypothetical protein